MRRQTHDEDRSYLSLSHSCTTVPHTHTQIIFVTRDNYSREGHEKKYYTFTREARERTLQRISPEQLYSTFHADTLGKKHKQNHEQSEHGTTLVSARCTLHFKFTDVTSS